MRVESKNFIVRGVNLYDMEEMEEVTCTPAWVALLQVDTVTEDLSIEDIYTRYVKDSYNWVIENKKFQFCGGIFLDVEYGGMGHLYIHSAPDAPIEGFGKELLIEAIDTISEETQCKDFLVTFWDDKDPDIAEFREAGYVVQDAELSIYVVSKDDMKLVGDAPKEQTMMIPTKVIINLTEWLQEKGMSSEEIVDCLRKCCG